MLSAPMGGASAQFRPRKYRPRRRPTVELLLTNGAAPGHIVQLHGADDSALVTHLASYVGEGLRRGHSVIAIATLAHCDAVTAALRADGVDVARETARGRLALLDNGETLAQLLVDGHPDAARFERVVGSVVRRALRAKRSNGLRIYGEMVGALWDAGNFAAALRLEQFWEHLQRELGFTLFCGYPIDVFGENFDGHVVNALLCAHTHLVPTMIDDRLERALGRAIHELLHLRPEELRARVQASAGTAWGTIPDAEGAILWLRREHPRYAGTILESEKTYLEAAGPGASQAS